MRSIVDICYENVEFKLKFLLKMGRSKFPGKPSKHINRKRVNVLPPNGEGPSIADPVTVIEDKQLLDEQDSANVLKHVNEPNITLKKCLNRKMQSSKTLRSKNAKRNLISRMCSKNVIKGNIINKMKRKKNGKNIDHKCYTLKNIAHGNQRESGNLGKFILPSRSVHSSRVIKPNKRFMDINETLTRKQKNFKRYCGGKEENVGEGNTTENNGKNMSQSDSCSNNRRIILRQARLQYHSQSYPLNSQGPFSSNSTNGSAPGTVTCGVCGAVRFYRFIKQARKFNIYSCESCRKFISKMIKRQSCNKSSTLVCHKGQGTCHVPPIVRSQQWKLIKCAYRARCPACWLKMCLRSFQMPVNLRNNLSLLLPQYMQTPDSVFGNNSLFFSSGIKSVDVSIAKPSASHLVDEKAILRPLRSNNNITTAINNNPPLTNSEIKRQKVGLKGPRVKHVCRSASIVLGQPVATFSEDKNRSDKLQACKENLILDEKLTDQSTFMFSEKNTINCKEAQTDFVSSEPESVDSDRYKCLSESDSSISIGKRDRSHRITSQLLAEGKSLEKNRNTIQMQQTISIDFWENYDPEDISKNGFSLISCEQFPMPSICFLCGSAGREALLHCSACCEPYHPFCLEQTPQFRENYNIKQFMWLCPRCTVCSSCNESDRTKVNCQKCYKVYHVECLNYGFNTKWTVDDRPTICSKCLRCKSCGAENITKFVGNLPLCMSCLKLRKKGNFCPLCQKCYYENDFCSKMMECAKCNKWVHSKCEGLLEEQYQILSLLPESIEYICKVCAKNSTPLWRKAVDAELTASFSNVLRLLSKNKIARDLLKWSPLNNNTPSIKGISTVKKLQFCEHEDAGGIDIQNNNTLDNDPAILDVKVPNVRTMLDIKNKLNSNEYHSVREYNMEMEEALNHTQSEQILKMYRSILHTIFPWYETAAHEESEQVPVNTLESGDLNISKHSMETNFLPQIELSHNDIRVCGFCKGFGDALGDQESRLLYCGQNEWVHANCALWSSEVYEEIDGSLQNVHSALLRGRSIKCAVCKQKGASVGCCLKGCYETYHFICARKSNCIFLHDKTVFCASHQLPKNCNIITSSQDFNIRRSIYVELDKKKGKYCEIEKVNFMVGSLCVTRLGKIYPPLSDTCDAIIPIGFVCSRLFWSTIEPWKLVCYNITTSPYNSNCASYLVDKNFTIDHSLPQLTIEKKIREVSLWQKDLERRKSDLVDLEDDEEPQSTADILSPELTDAILKELPHDLLDGISVQDIIPKLMPFEDLQAIDTSNSETGIIDDSDIKYNRDLKRCKSDIILHMNENLDKMSRERRDKSQTKACSVTLSCKFDRAVSPVLKKRKVSSPHEGSMYFKLLQVDGNFDDSASECESPTTMGVNSWQVVSEEPVTCEKCHCTYRTQASYKRHLDNCEILCTSESDSELLHEHENNNSFQESILTETCMNAQIDSSILMDNSQPMLINSYESSYNQLQTSVLNTYVKSNLTSVIPGLRNSPEIIIQNSQFDHKSAIPTLITSECNLQSISSETPIAINQQGSSGNHSEPSFTITQQSIPINESISVANNQSMTIPNGSFCVNQGVPICVNQPVHLQTNALTVNQPPSLMGSSSNMLNPVTLNQITRPTMQHTVEFPQPVTIQSVPFTGNLSQPMINISTPNQISLNGKMLANNNILNSVVTQAVSVPSTQWIKPITKLHDKNTKNRTKTKAIYTKRNTFSDNETIVIPTQNSSAPSVIVQHLPSTSFVPTFVDTFQQQTGQNLQYIATISPQINQTIQSQPIVQIQPENNLISLVPGMQSVIIQQPRVVENQLVMDSNGNLSWAQAPQTVQPVYYGFETIVQNTVMQSQQFLPTTVPGVLTANSSYSTTTQVFQTSKLEPVLDVSPNSFVLVNQGQLITSQPSVDIPRYSQPVRTITNTTNNDVRSQPIKYSFVSTGSHNKLPQIVSPAVNSNSINLPTAPFVQEQGIPTNVVTPTPKAVHVQNRPMNRVLPMQTTPLKEKHLQKSVDIQKIHEIKKSNLPRQCSDSSNKALIELGINSAEKRISSREISKSYMNLETSLMAIQKSVLNNHQAQESCKNFAKNSSLLEIQKTVDLIQTPNIENLKYAPEIISSTCDKDIPELNIPDYVNQMTRSPSTENVGMDVENISSSQNISQSSICLEDMKEIETPFSASPEEKTTACDLDSKESSKLQDDNDLLERLIKDQQIELSEKTHIKPSQKENIDTKNESLRIVFQKQSRDGTYKISNNITPKISSVQVAPLKPIKSNNTTIIPTPLSQVNKINSPSVKYVKKEKKCIAPNTEKKLITQEKKSDPQSILYTIETQDGFRYSSTSISELWSKVFETVQNARAAHNMPPLPEQSLNAMNNLHVLGLGNNGLKYLLEQLPAVSKCSKYKPSHHFPPINIDLEDEYAVGHSFGAIRSAPHTKRYNQYDMFGWLSSKHRRPENSVLYDMELPRRGSINNLPMAMRFRQLKQTSKYSVGVYRSNIHGRGLFCLRDIEAGEMVIEYSGEVIRSILCDKREKEYNQKGIGCYMFRIDDNLVVDATMKGNAARFINHSCDPNCYSKVVEILGHKHIIIFALRRIMYSEELTYDYKFPFEEDKIPCTCGTRRCRKFLN
ncbi:hypothetical protein WA026_010309 [Henosepilachna vigintioctopunctata]|uniref:Histone-lysine N-methyltransferase trithorax n=1 Tax=Henosepilachna vigintioctopunctata TaxID=420089 RepID=A0AAW1V556_9CUCU